MLKLVPVILAIVDTVLLYEIFKDVKKYLITEENIHSETTTTNEVSSSLDKDLAQRRELFKQYEEWLERR